MKYLILLRGFNIGGRTVKSADLRSNFEKAGFKNAQTVLATGNVLIESNENLTQLKAKIEKMLEATFNHSVKVLAVSKPMLEEIINAYPFHNVASDTHCYVIFTDNSEEKKLADQAKNLDDNFEAVQLGQGVVYWRVLKGHTLDSDFAKILTKFSRQNFTTSRNLNTLEKCLAKAG